MRDTSSCDQQPTTRKLLLSRCADSFLVFIFSSVPFAFNFIRVSTKKSKIDRLRHAHWWLCLPVRSQLAARLKDPQLVVGMLRSMLNKKAAESCRRTMRCNEMKNDNCTLKDWFIPNNKTASMICQNFYGCCVLERYTHDLLLVAFFTLWWRVMTYVLCCDCIE